MPRRAAEYALVPAMFLLGVFSAIFCLGARPPIAGGGETVAIAQSIVRTGTYGNPFLTIPTGPSAVIVPGYPLFLALNMKLFGDDFRKAVAILTFALHGLHLVLLLFCARRMFANVWPGVWAGGLSTALPVFRFLPAWDSMMTANGLMLFYLMLTGGRRDTPGAARLTGLGLLGGALLLLNASALLVVLVFLVLHYARRPGWREARTALATLAIAGLCLLPWIIRNERVLGSAVMKDNFGFTAYASNNDCAQPALDQMFECYQAHHAHGSRAEARLIVEKGEVAYDHYRLDSTLEWVRAHPARFTKLTALRVVAFWMPLPSGGPFHWAVWPVTALAAFGLWWMIKRRHPVALEIAVVFLIYPLMYYVIVADTRYRYPIMWLSLLAAGFACQQLWEKVDRRSVPARSPEPEAVELNR